MVKKLFIVIIFLIFFSTASAGVVVAQEKPCSDSLPVYSPNLYKVDTTQTSATIFFIEPKDKLTGYTLSYGLGSDATGYTQQFIAASYNETVMFTLNNLAPDAVFYFKVRSENGCAHGPWSAIRASNYPNSKSPRLPTTADESYSLVWLGLCGMAITLLGAMIVVFSQEKEYSTRYDKSE